MKDNDIWITQHFLVRPNVSCKRGENNNNLWEIMLLDKLKRFYFVDCFHSCSHGIFIFCSSNMYLLLFLSDATSISNLEASQRLY